VSATKHIAYELAKITIVHCAEQIRKRASQTICDSSSIVRTREPICREPCRTNRMQPVPNEFGR